MPTTAPPSERCGSCDRLSEAIREIRRNAMALALASKKEAPYKLRDLNDSIDLASQYTVPPASPKEGK